MKDWSAYWKSSEKAGKQRKYRYNAPLHIRGRFISSHLSKDLKVKYNTRSLSLRKGDTVKVVRGTHKGRTGKIDSIDRKRYKVYVEGVRITKTDGNERPVALEPSNLVITGLNTEDKLRLKNITKEAREAQKEAKKAEPKQAKEAKPAKAREEK